MSFLTYTKVTGRPVARAAHFAKQVNHDVDFVGLITFFPFIPMRLELNGTSAQRFASEQKEPFLVTQRTLWKRLADKGLLVDRDLSDGKNRASSRKWIGDKSRRVAIILKSSLDSGKDLPTRKISGNARDPHEYKAEGQHSHYAHYSTHTPATFSKSRDDGSGRANLHADAVDKKNLGGYVRNSGHSGNVRVEANTYAGFGHSHSPQPVGIPSHSAEPFSNDGKGGGETARVYAAILQLNGRPVDGLRLAEL